MENTIILRGIKGNAPLYTTEQIFRAVEQSELRPEQKASFMNDVNILLETYVGAHGMVDNRMLHEAALENGITITVFEAKEYTKTDIAHVLSTNNIYSHKYKEEDIPDELVPQFNLKMTELTDRYPDLNPMISDDYLGQADDEFYDVLVGLTEPLGISLFDQSKLPPGNLGSEDNEGGTVTESKEYRYIVDKDERGEFSAHVEDEEGKNIWDSGEGDGMQQMIEDGFMANGTDVDGLEQYLIDQGLINTDDTLVLVSEKKNYFKNSKSIPEDLFHPGDGVQVRNTKNGSIQKGTVYNKVDKRPFYSKRLDSYLVQLEEAKKPVYIRRSNIITEAKVKVFEASDSSFGISKEEAKKAEEDLMKANIEFSTQLDAGFEYFIFKTKDIAKKAYAALKDKFDPKFFTHAEWAEEALNEDSKPGDLSGKKVKYTDGNEYEVGSYSSTFDSYDIMTTENGLRTRKSVCKPSDIGTNNGCAYQLVESLNESADWDDSNFIKEPTGYHSNKYKYVPFHELSDAAQKDAKASYTSKGAGAKYNFKHEHYFYPVKTDGSLANGDRSLAIPLVKIQDDEYMKSLGYEKNPDWKDIKEELTDNKQSIAFVFTGNGDTSDEESMRKVADDFMIKHPNVEYEFSGYENEGIGGDAFITYDLTGTEKDLFNLVNDYSGNTTDEDEFREVFLNESVKFIKEEAETPSWVDGFDSQEVDGWLCASEHPGVLNWYKKGADGNIYEWWIAATPNWDGDGHTPVDLMLIDGDVKSLGQMGIDFPDFASYAKAMKPWLAKVKDDGTINESAGKKTTGRKQIYEVAENSFGITQAEANKAEADLKAANIEFEKQLNAGFEYFLFKTTELGKKAYAALKDKFDPKFFTHAEWAKEAKVNEAHDGLSDTTVKEINTVADVEKFFLELMKNDDLAFHPDDPFSGYGHTDESGRWVDLYTPAEAERLQALMDKCFDVCDAAGGNNDNEGDVYGIGMKVMKANGFLPDGFGEDVDEAVKESRKKTKRGIKEDLTPTILNTAKNSKDWDEYDGNIAKACAMVPGAVRQGEYADTLKKIAKQYGVEVGDDKNSPNINFIERQFVDALKKGVTPANEENITDVEPKKGKMHSVLGVPDDKEIEDVYTSGAGLAKALTDKVGKAKASQMLNYAANVNKNSKQIFKDAAAAMKDVKESLVNEEGKLKYFARWTEPTYKADAKMVDVDAFSDDKGYSEEDRTAIKKLKHGETWKSDQGDHEVTAMNESAIKEFASKEDPNSSWGSRMGSEESNASEEDAKPTDEWEVNVGNVGNVGCADEKEARATFADYVKQSKESGGKASGEDVFLMKNGEPVDEYYGTLGSTTNESKQIRKGKVVTESKNRLRREKLRKKLSEDKAAAFDVKSKSVYHADSEKDARNYVSKPASISKPEGDYTALKHTDGTWHVVKTSDIPTGYKIDEDRKKGEGGNPLAKQISFILKYQKYLEPVGQPWTRKKLEECSDEVLTDLIQNIESHSEHKYAEHQIDEDDMGGEMASESIFLPAKEAVKKIDEAFTSTKLPTNSIKWGVKGTSVKDGNKICEIRITGKKSDIATFKKVFEDAEFGYFPNAGSVTKTEYDAGKALWKQSNQDKPDSDFDDKLTQTKIGSWISRARKANKA